MLSKPIHLFTKEEKKTIFKCMFSLNTGTDSDYIYMYIQRTQTEEKKETLRYLQSFTFFFF